MLPSLTVPPVDEVTLIDAEATGTSSGSICWLDEAPEAIVEVDGMDVVVVVAGIGVVDVDDIGDVVDCIGVEVCVVSRTAATMATMTTTATAIAIVLVFICFSIAFYVKTFFEIYYKLLTNQTYFTDKTNDKPRPQGRGRRSDVFHNN
jgi:hypothetical protein